MSISLVSGFDLKSKQPDFRRQLYDKISDLKDIDYSHLPSEYIVQVKETPNTLYTYSDSNEEDSVYGKFRPIISIESDQISNLIKDATVDSEAKTVKLIRNNETIINCDLTELINSAISGLNYGKAKYATEKPICSLVDGEYCITYIDKSDNTSKTVSALNTWFYYELSDDNGTYTVQTLWVDGEELTIKTAEISNVLSIDQNTKNWILYGQDTGICSEAKHSSITENSTNSVENRIYKLDTKYYDGTKWVEKTSPNLYGRDGIMIPQSSMFSLCIDHGCLFVECDDDNTPPPLAIEVIDGVRCLTYTIDGEIQGTLVVDNEGGETE